VKAWFVRLFHALMPSLDPERQAWRAEMERQYEASRKQINPVEPAYLRGRRD
jgi:hypothetical protein